MRRLATPARCLVLGMMIIASSGCSDDNNRPQVPEPPADPPPLQGGRGFVRVTEATWPDSVAHLTMNNRWTAADMEALGISRSNVLWEGEPDAEKGDGFYEPGQIVPYTTRLSEYRKLRSECARDFLVTNADGDRKCYPELTQVKANSREVVGPIDASIAGSCKVGGGITLGEIRYGRYCGGGYPDYGVWLDNRILGDRDPTPIDGVDYCCRLHDANAWNLSASGGLGAIQHKNICGWAMCVSQATEFPAGISTEAFSETLQARQCIWNRATTWVTSCSVKQEFQIAPPPALAPLPAPPQTRLRWDTGQDIEAAPNPN